MSKFKQVDDTDGRITFLFICPGCDQHHQIWTGKGNGKLVWVFNDDIEKPTCSPSLLIRMGPECDPETGLALPGKPDRICHSIITNGFIQFLPDCTHHLSGKTVEIPDINDMRSI
jgi:hypothetical protein